jgi:hypothetical protein
MNGFIGVHLQLHTWNDVVNTSTIQLPSDFSSTDGFSAATECLTNCSTEEPVVSRILILDSVSQPKLVSRGPEIEHHVLQFLCYSAYPS